MGRRLWLCSAVLAAAWAAACGKCSADLHPDTRAADVQHVIWHGEMDEYACCTICEDLLECDVFEVSNTTCRMLKLEASGTAEPEMEKQPGVTLGIVRIARSVIRPEQTYCYESDGQRTPLVNNEYCAAKGGRWHLRVTVDDEHYGDCLTDEGSVLSAEQVADICAAPTCPTPMGWRQINSADPVPEGWCLGTTSLVEEDFLSAKAAMRGTWTIACLADGNIGGAGYDYEMEKGVAEFDLCNRYLYTDCCLDQGTHQNTVIEVGGFRFDLAIPSLITYAIMGGFFFFWNTMLAFALVGRTVAACFFLEWGRHTCMPCICPHWLVGIVIPYLVGGPLLAVLVSIPYLIAIPRACLQMKRQGYHLCPTARRLIAHGLHGPPRPPDPSLPREPGDGAADAPGLEEEMSEYGSDVEIHIPAGPDDLERLHSGTECCICLDPYKDEVMAQCGHSFCSACITAVCRSAAPYTRGYCPLCRKSIAMRELRLVERNALLTEEMDQQRGSVALDAGAADGPGADPAALQQLASPAPLPGQLYLEVQTSVPWQRRRSDAATDPSEALGTPAGPPPPLVTVGGTLAGGRWAAAFHVKLTRPVPEHALTLDLCLTLDPPATGSTNTSPTPGRVLRRTVDVGQVLAGDGWRHLLVGVLAVPADGTAFEASLRVAGPKANPLWCSSLLIDCLVLTPLPSP
eukprot:EG_transcript_3007